MSSQYCGPETFLQTIFAPTFLKEIDVNLPSVIEFLEKNNSHKDFASVLRVLFNDGMALHNLESVQSLYLQDVLEVTRRLFCDCLNNAVLTLESILKELPDEKVAASLQRHLTVALDILGGYAQLLNWLLNKTGSIELCKLESVPKNLVTVVRSAFCHYKNSKTMYGQAYIAYEELLSSLFKKSFEVQTNLMRLVDEKLIFNCNLENDLSILLQVLESVSCVGDVVVGMEPKAAIVQWKIFTKLASTHSLQLKSRLELGVPLSSLLSMLKNIIQSVTSDQVPTENALQKYLKLGNFIFKIIIKLCELYCGYLGECHANLIELLINLNKCDQLLEEGTELCSAFKSYLSVGSLPLLTHLLPDRQFVSEFKKLSETLPSLTSDAKLGFFALSVNILRKLLKSTPDIQKLWWNENLLQSVIIIVKDCCCSLDNVARFDDKEGYSCLVASTSILMATILIGNDFHKAEHILFSTLCQGEFFSSIFVQDMLCLLARFTKEKVVVKWIEWLKKNVISAEGPVKVHFSLLERRLTNFLSPKTLSLFKSNSPEENDFSIIPHSPCVDDFNYIIRTLTSVTPEENNSIKICKWICELWATVVRSRPKIEVQEIAIRGLLWWTFLVNRLTLATKKFIYNFNDAQLLKCLESMRSVVDGADSYCKASCSMIFPGICPLLPSHPCLKMPTVNLACFLCSDNDEIIVQLTLEALCPFLATGDLYKSMVTKMPTLEGVLALYLAKKPQEGSNANDFDLFDSLTTDEYNHNCSTRQEDVEIEVISSVMGNEIDVMDEDPPAKKLKLNDEFDSLINQGTTLYTTMDNYLAINSINPKQIAMLESFIRDVSNLKKYL